jgi:hypothetical protein
MKIINNKRYKNLIQEQVEYPHTAIQESNEINYGSSALNSEEQKVFDEGKKLFTHLSVKEATTKTNTTPHKRFFPQRKNKGSYTVGGMKVAILIRKINLVLEKALSLGATDIYHSKSSNSVYFSIKDKKYRVSDHFVHFDGVDIIIKWDTPLEEAISRIP